MLTSGCFSFANMLLTRVMKISRRNTNRSFSVLLHACFCLLCFVLKLIVQITLLSPKESLLLAHSDSHCPRNLILLPSNLPPTFRGRTFRFAYDLVGICHSTSDTASVNGDNLLSTQELFKLVMLSIIYRQNLIFHLLSNSSLPTSKRMDLSNLYHTQFPHRYLTAQMIPCGQF